MGSKHLGGRFEVILFMIVKYHQLWKPQNIHSKPQDFPFWFAYRHVICFYLFPNQETVNFPSNLSGGGRKLNSDLSLLSKTQSLLPHVNGIQKYFLLLLVKYTVPFLSGLTTFTILTQPPWSNLNPWFNRRLISVNSPQPLMMTAFFFALHWTVLIWQLFLSATT